MDEEFDTSFDTSDTDFSSDIDSTDIDCDTSSDLEMDDASYDTLDDISDNVSDFGTESEVYDTLDDISDIESDEMDYDTLDDIGEDMTESEFEESNFENVTDEASEDVPEADLTEETSDVETDVGDNMDEVYSDDEYETLEDLPDEATIVEENEDSDIETLDDIQEDESVTEEEEPEYETLDDIPDNEDETVVDEQEIETLDDISDEQPTETLCDVEDELSHEETDIADEDETKTLNVDENSDEILSETTEGTAIEDSIENDSQDHIPEEITDDALNDAKVPEVIESIESESGVEDSDIVPNTNDVDSAIDKIMNSDLSPEHKKELLQNLRDEVSQENTINQPEIYQETEEQNMDNFLDDDNPKVLKRDLTDEVLAARDRDTEETLDNYRENLRNYGVDEETIEEFINQERDKINADFESLDNGDISSNIYYPPTNWEEVANELKNPEGVSDSTNIDQAVEVQDINDISGWLGDINPNFDEFDPESPYCNNCGSCAFAVYNRLNGDSDMCASAENIGYNDEMNALTGMEQVSMSPEEIENRLLTEGDGAHAIIGIDRAEGPGHWFNAACVDGKVVAIDGQTGEILDWPPDYGDVVNWEMSVKKGDK